MPKAAVKGRSGEVIACTALLASKAFACSVLNNAFPSKEAGASAGRPKRTRCNGCGGICSIGCKRFARCLSMPSTTCPCKRTHALLSTPSPAAVSSKEFHKIAVSALSSGCAISIGAFIHVNPCSSSFNSRKAGLATPKGWPAAPRSTVAPAKSCVDERAAPPGVEAAS